MFVSTDEALRWLRDPKQVGFIGAEELSLKTLVRVVARNVHPDAGGERSDWDKYEQAIRTLKEGGLLS
jgi:hypothetical protein